VTVADTLIADPVIHASQEESAFNVSNTLSDVLIPYLTERFSDLIAFRAQMRLGPNRTWIVEPLLYRAGITISTLSSKRENMYLVSDLLRQIGLANADVFQTRDTFTDKWSISWHADGVLMQDNLRKEAEIPVDTETP
ncbi:MAG: hypothetical protein K2F99_04535, partial [Muribaculaceae bacterium]|nr:hypothetical protein [Muribaculaceae bacterium]